MPLDEDVVAAIYRDHGTALKRFVLSCTPDTHQADDVVQETILKVWQHAPQITGQSAQLPLPDCPQRHHRQLSEGPEAPRRGRRARPSRPCRDGTRR